MLTTLIPWAELKISRSVIFLAATGKQGWLSAGTIVLTLAILLAIGLAVLAYYLIWGQKPSADSHSRSLFRELCRAHHLTGNQSRLVWRLGTLLKLACPATLFVDSTAWRIPQADLDKRDWDKLEKIHKMLFQPPNVFLPRAKP